MLFITGYAEKAAVRNGFLEPGMQVVTVDTPAGRLGLAVAALGQEVEADGGAAAQHGLAHLVGAGLHAVGLCLTRLQDRRALRERRGNPGAVLGAYDRYPDSSPFCIAQQNFNHYLYARLKALGLPGPWG